MSSEKSEDKKSNEPAKKASVTKADKLAKEASATKVDAASKAKSAESASSVPSSKRLDPSRLETAQPTSRQDDADDLEALKTKSKQELIDMVLKLKKQVVRTTGILSDAPLPQSFDTTPKIEQYVRLPEGTAQKREGEQDVVWRVELISSNAKFKSLGIDIHHDIVIGRAGESMKPHLDLTEYDAVNKGVSRQHALLRPTGSGLFLVDLKSTNGTFYNSTKVEAGVRKKINDGDVISFGQVHFKVNIIKKPEVEKSEKKPST